MTARRTNRAISTTRRWTAGALLASTLAVGGLGLHLADAYAATPSTTAPTATATPSTTTTTSSTTSSPSSSSSSTSLGSSSSTTGSTTTKGS